MLEMLLALAVTAVIAAATMSAVLASRRILDGDMERLRLDQDLRTGIALLGIELRQTGERLPGDFPAVEIVDGPSGAPDVLIMRRNLLDQVLPVCKKLTKNETDVEVRVAKDVSDPPKGCAPLPDENTDGWPDNIEVWRNERIAAGGKLRAYVYNPVKKKGEFLVYDGDGSTPHYLHKADDGPWANTYRVKQQCRIYVLEERRYELDGDVLQFVVNDDTANPSRLLHDVTDFQVRVVLADGSVVDSFSVSDDWSELAGIDVTVTGARFEKGEMRTRTVNSRFFPRNVLSL